jgi:CheY-like chemotaxis protein
LPKKCVLIIEDDEDILELVRFNLEKEGYAVAGVTTGEDGVGAARSHPPDLVLLDLMLPGMDGLEVCRELKGHPIDRQTYPEVRAAIRERPDDMEALIRLLRVSQNLERIADHTTNIAEDVIYLAEGEIIRHSGGER